MSFDFHRITNICWQRNFNLRNKLVNRSMFKSNFAKELLFHQSIEKK